MYSISANSLKYVQFISNTFPDEIVLFTLFKYDIIVIVYCLSLYRLKKYPPKLRRPAGKFSVLNKFWEEPFSSKLC